MLWRTSKKFNEKRREFIHYSAVGVTLTIGNWILYAICVRNMPMVTANVFSWAVTVILAYLGNKLFVFGSPDWDIHTVMWEFIAYLGARGATGLIEVSAQPMLYHMGMDQRLFGVEGLASKIIVSLIVMVMNYYCSRFLVFRQKQGGEEQVWHNGRKYGFSIKKL